METIEETMSGNIGFGRKCSVTIIRNGDLATNLYLKVVLASVTTANLNSTTAKFAWCRRLGHALIKNVNVSIGGSQIDKQYSTWMDVWYELTHSEEQTRGYAEMIGDVADLTKLRVSGDPESNFGSGVYTPAYTMYIPLQFWFCRNTGLALPLIALQYHEVRLEFEFNNAADLICYTGATAPTALTMTDASLLVNYVYLDSDERRRFAQVGHEYLIEQVQFTGEESIPTGATTTSGKYNLGFNHPTKELIWAVKGGNWTSGLSYIHYSHDVDWTTKALDKAAQNLAKSMFTVTSLDNSTVGTAARTTAQVNPGTTLTSALTNGDYITSGLYYFNATTDGSYAVYGNGTTTGGGLSGTGLTVTVLISDGIAYDVDAANGPAFNIGSTGPTTNYRLLLVANALGDATNNYWLSGEITDVVVTIALNASNLPYVQNVSVNAHSLTMRDISIPISNLTDNRVRQTSASSPVVTDVVVKQQHNYGLLIDGTGNPVSAALIQLNGQDRFDQMNGSYFNYVQPFQHHTRTPADGICVYSFALHPEQHQPSGTANLSRIDKTQLNLNFADTTFVTGLPALGFWNSSTLLYVYAFSYNVLRIMSGMGGLAYSN